MLEGNAIYRNIYCLLAGNEGNIAHCTPGSPSDYGYSGVKMGLLPSGWEWVAYFVAGFAIIFLLINSIMIASALYTWLSAAPLEGSRLV